MTINAVPMRRPDPNVPRSDIALGDSAIVKGRKPDAIEDMNKKRD